MLAQRISVVLLPTLTCMQVRHGPHLCLWLPRQLGPAPLAAECHCQQVQVSESAGLITFVTANCIRLACTTAMSLIISASIASPQTWQCAILAQSMEPALDVIPPGMSDQDRGLLLHALQDCTPWHQGEVHLQVH
jgi:hypothetical protein